MYQLSLPAESLFASQALTLTKPKDTKDTKDTKAVTFKPSSKGVYKMQYTSIIVLGFLNAFALAVPINQIREAGLDSGLAAAEAAITEYGKRSPIPSEAAAAVVSAEETASEAIGNGIMSGETGLESGLTTAESANAEYGRRRRSAMPIPPDAAAAIANAEKTAGEAIANGEKSATAGIKSGEAAAAKGEASGEAAAAAGVKSGEAAEAEGIATADAAIKEYGG